MTERFKIVFHVEDMEKRQVFPPQQTVVEFTLEELALDYPAELAAILRKARTDPLDDAEKAKMKELTATDQRVREFLGAAGLTISKFVRMKLREWAQARLKEPM